MLGSLLGIVFNAYNGLLGHSVGGSDTSPMTQARTFAIWVTSTAYFLITSVI
jgi:hypothetical protein